MGVLVFCLVHYLKNYGKTESKWPRNLLSFIFYYLYCKKIAHANLFWGFVLQLLLKFHLCTGNRSMEERISSLAIDIYYTIQQQMKVHCPLYISLVHNAQQQLDTTFFHSLFQENVEKILECAESNCPFVTSKEVQCLAHIFCWNSNISTFLLVSKIVVN